MTLRTALCLIAVIATIRPAAQAQRAEGRLSVSAGNATDVTGIGSRAATAAVTMLIAPTPLLGFQLGASGTQFGAGQWSGTIGGAMSARSPGRFAMTLDGGADFTTTSYRISYLVTSATPALQATAGPLTLFGGARGSRAAVMAPDVTDQPIPPLGRSGESRRTVVRTGLTGLAGVMVDFTGGHAQRLTARIAEERGTVADDPHRERQVSAAFAQGPLTISGYAGIREASGERTTFGGAAGSIMLSRTVTLDVAAGGYPANRLTGMAAGRFVSAGLTLRLSPSAPALPRPAAPPVPPGMTRLSIAAPNASKVEVAGDFSNWQPLPAQRAANGVWYADLRLSPGEYRYAFRINEKEWRVPTGARTADDEFGGKSAWVTVKETGAHVVKQ